MIAELAVRRDEPGGVTDWAADEVAAALHLSSGTAAFRTDQARELAGRLPDTLALWERGKIDQRRVTVLCDATTNLSLEHAAAVEARVLARAPEQTAAQLRASVKRAISPSTRPVPPSGTRPPARPGGSRSTPRTTAWPRCGRCSRHRRGRVIRVVDPPRAWARRHRPAEDGRTPRRSARRPVDRPVAQRRSAVAHPGAPGQAAGPGRGADHGAVGRQPGAGRAGRGYGPIPAELARKLAEHATWRRLLTDARSGALLDFGTTCYAPPVRLAEFVKARDVYCRFPGCRRTAVNGEVDHVIPYPTGPTSENNLFGYCVHHHHLKHQAGWRVKALPDGRLEWITPAGHSYVTYPYDYRGDPDPP